MDLTKLENAIPVRLRSNDRLRTFVNISNVKQAEKIKSIQKKHNWNLSKTMQVLIEAGLSTVKD